MQSRRYDDLGTKARLRNHEIVLRDDRYLRKGSPQARRSLSPYGAEGSQIVMSGGTRRSGSLETREYRWDLDVERNGRVHLRSPHYGQIRKRHPYDEPILTRDELRQRDEFFYYLDENTYAASDLKHQYGYEHGTSEVTRAHDSESTGQRIMCNKSMVLEDCASHGLYRLPADIGSSLRYADGSGHFASSSVNINLDWSKEENVHYSDSSLLSKVPTMESYGRVEKDMFHSSNASYSLMRPSPSREVVGVSHFKGPADSSLGMFKTNITGLASDNISMPVDGYSRSFTKLIEPMKFSKYDERLILDSRRAPQTEYQDLTHYWQDTLSPTTTEHRDYLCPETVQREGDFGYLPDKLHGRMTLFPKGDTERRDGPRHTFKEPTNDYDVNDTDEHSHSNPQNQSSWEHFSLRKQPHYIHTSRYSAAVKQGCKYLYSGCVDTELERKMLREQELPHTSAPKHHDFRRSRLDYTFGKDVGPVSYEEQMRRSPEMSYEAEIHGVAGRTHRIQAEELGIYESHSVLKRKHVINEEIREHTSKKMMMDKWNNSNRRQGSYTGDDKWMNSGYGYDVYERAERKFRDADHSNDYASDDWFSSHDLVNNAQKHSIQPYKPGGKYVKGHSKHRSFSHYQSHGSSGKHGFPKQHNVWIRGRDEKKEPALANEVEQSQDYMTSVKHEPPEDSEKFKQLVHNFFLSFIKKLNGNPVARKRYEEQGRAGSLFCIVCGRSQSKEFLDTESLARHTCMSHRLGLRAQHLGLHRAICVLMEWNTAVYRDVVTWFPAAISSEEALEQQEDLILWPPVLVIHNSSIVGNNIHSSSISGKNTKGHKIITVEGIMEFLRSKGISSGRIKVCLGKPSNHSTMVVKFVGTISGLQDADKLHKYFFENKHGRKDFKKIALSKGRIRNDAEESQGDKIEKTVLYGYMGIAEDLDNVDFDTKKKCSIKSKEEIWDFVEGPVKS